MTPNEMTKSGTEHAHQVAFFAYCAVARLHGFYVADAWCETGVIKKLGHSIPPLAWIHAIPNGGSRGDSVQSRAIRGGQLKAEGVRKGIADIFLPYPKFYLNGSGVYHGLYIEMKKPAQKPKNESSIGDLSNEQIDFRNYCVETGYKFEVCYSWQDAVLAIKIYLT